MDSCPLCFEDMDMKSYEDERDCTPTCFKLECKHSFHTKCIIECLTHANRKCPSCNSQKNADELLSAEGLCDRLMKELKNDVDVRYLVNEYKEASAEFKSTFSQLKKEVKEFAKKRGEELQFFEKRNYNRQCLHAIKTEMKHTARLLGSKYLGAMLHGDKWERDRRFRNIILGDSHRRHYYRIRTQTSYFYITI